MLHAAVAAAALLAAAWFLFVALRRIDFPFEHEWMEGAMADHVGRILAGERIYTPPAFEHVAFLYHPGYFYTCALLASAIGEGLLPLRLVSLLATCGSALTLFVMVRRDGNSMGGVVAAGVFLAGFSLTGCYFDVGRIDPLFTFLLLGGIRQTAASRGRPGIALAVLWFLAAWLTKQTAMVILPVAVLGLLPRGIWRALGFGLALAVVCGTAEWVLDVVHDGWFSYFNLTVPRSHRMEPQFLRLYFGHDLVPLGGAALLLSVFVWRAGDRATALLHLGWIAGCVLGSCLSRLHVGGAENVLIPVLAAAAAGCGLGYSRLDRLAGRPLCLLGQGIAVVQILALIGLPFVPVTPRFGVPVVPSENSRRAAELLLADVRGRPGPVFLPWHGYVARLAGKGPSAHVMAMDDVWRSHEPRAIERLDTALHDRLSTPPYPVVYVSDVQHNVLRPLWERAGYRVERVLDPQIAGYRHAVGSLLWPRVVLVKD
ncbi:MAG: hypothetical protein H6836_04730 [Planctomycetes bacterium]|nr:hypothetical protein [Planctomycetota bacterium]MCB9888859.1 hypothetical protein [Planctomycetota bacterium]